MLGALGVGAAFAWFAISLFSGPSAHAADDTDNPLGSLVGGVSSTLSKVTTPVLDPVAEILSPVAETVAPVVESVARRWAASSTPSPPSSSRSHRSARSSPRRLGGRRDRQPLAPVLAPVTGAVKPIVDAAAPVTDAVSSLPVVGELVTPITSVVVPLSGPGILLRPLRACRGTPADAALAVLSAAWDQTMHGVATTTTAAALARQRRHLVRSGRGRCRIPGSARRSDGGWGLLGPTLDATSFFSSGAGFSFGAGAVPSVCSLHTVPGCCDADGGRLCPPAPVFATDVSPD
jgi:hypothetical protein